MTKEAEVKSKVLRLLRGAMPIPEKPASAQNKTKPTFSIVYNYNIKAGRDVHMNKQETICNVDDPNPECSA